MHRSALQRLLKFQPNIHEDFRNIVARLQKNVVSKKSCLKVDGTIFMLEQSYLRDSKTFYI